tara:strand:- start:1315 stop:1617 length:303 start_codon:yes stop_codon:yes gene_type:complete
MKTKHYTRGDEGFEAALDQLEKKYFHNGGDEEAETIVNWSKQEVKEDGVVCIFASNSVISSAIKRCRKGIKKVEVLPVGANLYFYSKYVRPLYMVLKVVK